MSVIKQLTYMTIVKYWYWIIDWESIEAKSKCNIRIYTIQYTRLPSIYKLDDKVCLWCISCKIEFTCMLKGHLEYLLRYSSALSQF